MFKTCRGRISALRLVFILVSGSDLKVSTLITCLNAAVLCWSGHGEDWMFDVCISRDPSTVYYSVVLLFLTCRLGGPSGTLAKEQGSPELVSEYGAQRAGF